MSKVQKWIPDKYQKNASFVPELGMPVIDLLAPKQGEYILDLGCGNGILMQKLIESGCKVMGVDSSSEMIRATLELGLDAQILNGENLNFEEKFDAVFSNASLHWMTKADLVIKGVFQALKPGGRFVAELGGAGNVATVVNAISICLQKRGIEISNINPWFFPEKEDYQQRLEAQGFIVQSITIFERPTPLPQGIREWLEMFAQQFTNVLPSENSSIFLEEVIELCQPQLCDAEGNWIADYVRLRFSALKPNPN